MPTTTASHEPLTGCPLCGERSTEPLFTKDGWPIARCPGCTLVYANARVDREALERIYGRAYYEGEVFADYLSERDARLASARARVRHLAAFVPGGRLLDLGCAAGFFLLAAAERYDVTGVEVSGFASRFAREQLGLPVITGEIFDAQLPDSEFNVVTMWDVVEHLAEPRAVLSEVARITRPGGLLVISTGNVGGPLARRDLERWNLMTPPAHLSFFSGRTIEQLLNDEGFEVQRVVGDGWVSTRPRLANGPVRFVAGTLGAGNVMTVFARRTETPDRHPIRSRLPHRVTGLLRRGRTEP